MSSLPYLACWLFINVSSMTGDRLIQSKKISRKNVRKIFNGIGLSVPVCSLIGISFITCATPYLGVALLVIGFAFMGCSLGAGYYVNINDVSGPYSSVVFGISNTFGSLPGLICPYITAVITQHKTQKEWQVVFIISAAVYLFGFVFYTLFSNTDVEPWAVVNKEAAVVPVKDTVKKNKVFAKEKENKKEDDGIVAF
jgi:MFS family permease